MARRKNQTAGKAAAPETASKAAEKKEVSSQTEPMKRAAAELAKAVAEEAKTPEVKTPAGKTAAEKKEEKKPVEKKASEKPAVEKKTEEKAAVEKKTAEKPVKKQEIKTSIAVQYMGKDISDKDMIALVKKDWTAAKHKVGDIKTMELYVKTEENKVYYVINGTETGSVEI